MRYYTIDAHNKLVRFFFDYGDPERDKIRVRIDDACQESHWNPEFKCWIIPFSDYTRIDIIAIVEDFGFECKEEEKKVFPIYNYAVADEIMHKMKDVCESRGFTYFPRKYQYEALYYALDKHSFINGDDMGIGKTFEAIIYTEVLKAFPTVVVVPASVKYNWGEKWAEIVGEHRTISVIESSKSLAKNNNWDADVVILNYEILGTKAGKGIVLKFPELYKKWKMFIFDEAHALKTRTSQRSKASKLLVKGTKSPIQLLTGTAIMSKPSELWSLISLIGKSDFISESEQSYNYRYCGAYRGKYGMITSGATNMLELNYLMRKHCYLRREKREVLTDMPPVTTEIINMQITNTKDIKNAQDDLYGFLLEHKGEESADKAMEAQTLVLLGVLRKLSITGKLKAIEQYLNDWEETGKKLVIFGLHREELEYLSNKFNSPLIAGGVSSIKKQKIVKTWIEDDTTFLFANIASAGTGVDGLQLVCSNMLVLEIPWRPSDLGQTIARIDRSGQLEPCNVRYALSPQTIDVEMWDMVGDKEVIAEAVNKGVDMQNEESGMKMVMRKFLENQRKIKNK